MDRNEVKQSVETRLAAVGRFTEVKLDPNVYAQTWRYYSDETSVDIYVYGTPEEVATEFARISLPVSGHKGVHDDWFFTVEANKKPGDNRVLLSIFNALSSQE